MGRGQLDPVLVKTSFFKSMISGMASSTKSALPTATFKSAVVVIFSRAAFFFFLADQPVFDKGIEVGRDAKGRPL